MHSKNFLKQLYRTMVLIRLCEESLIEPILEGDIRCPVHLYTGEEAIAAGVCAALSKDDCLFGTHRSHGHYLAKGGGLKELVAEIYGKEAGCSRGRGGSMHLIQPEKGMMGAVPIVAGTISLALGAGLASRIRGDKRVSVSFFGDGAVTEGVLYESLNFASLKRLPVLFVCENNFYSTHMPIRKCRPDNSIFKIGKPYGIPSSKVNGNKVLKVYEAAAKGVDMCRENKGPVFLECVTYRLRGHVGPDDNIQGTHTDIRPKQEIESWEKKDPIRDFERYLLNNNIFKEGEAEEVKKRAQAEVDDAHRFARNSAYPEERDLVKYVFKQ